MAKREISKFDNELLYTIYNFKTSVQNRKFVLYTNSNEIISVRFPKLVVFDFLILNHKVKKKDGTYNETLKEIVGAIYAGQSFQIRKKDRNRIKTQSLKINKLVPITLNNIHSIIEKDDNIYLVMSSKKGDIVLKLLKQKGDKISYIVIDILDISYINELINDDSSYVSIPARSECLKYEGTKKQRTEICKLSKNEKLERLIKLREFLIDKDENTSYKDYLSKVPITKTKAISRR